MFALPAVSDNRGGRRRTEGPAGRQIIRWMGRRRSILSAPSNGGRQTMADRRGPSLFVRRVLIKSFVPDSQCDTTVNTKKKFQTNMFSTCKNKIISGFVTDVSCWFLVEVFWVFFSSRTSSQTAHHMTAGVFSFYPSFQRCIIQYLHTTKSKLLKTSCFFIFLKLFVKMRMCCYLLGFG